MLTQRAALLGFVAFCFYLISVVNNLPSFYYALTWVATGILGASFGIALLSLIGLESQIEVKRSLGTATLSDEAASGPLVSLALQNGGTLNKTSLIVELRFADAQNALQSHRFVIEAVPSGASIEADLPLFHLKRGDYRLEEARIISSDVLGLFRVQKRLVLPSETPASVLVGPVILPGESVANNGGGSAPLGTRRTVQSGMGEELRGTRPYAPGDDLRHVHWKSSARAGELVVKEWEQMGREAVLIAWDGAQNTSWGVREWDSTEWGLILVASLCQTLLGVGTPCALARCDVQPLLVEARSLVGNELPPQMVRALAGARAAREISLQNALLNLPHLAARSYSTVILISASLGSDLVETARVWQGRGANVRVVLVDGASLGARCGDRRFRARASSPPTQKDGTRLIPVTSKNYEIQAQTLRESGIEVVFLAASEDILEISLRRAVREILRPSKAAFRIVRNSVSAE